MVPKFHGKAARMTLPKGDSDQTIHIIDESNKEADIRQLRPLYSVTLLNTGTTNVRKRITEQRTSNPRNALQICYSLGHRRFHISDGHSLESATTPLSTVYFYTHQCV